MFHIGKLNGQLLTNILLEYGADSTVATAGMKWLLCNSGFWKGKDAKICTRCPAIPCESMFNIFSLTPHRSYRSHQDSRVVCQTESRHLTMNSPSRVDMAKILLVGSQNRQYLEITTW